MDERTLKVVEYYKIIAMLESYAQSEMGKEIVRSLRPVADKEKVAELLEETSEAESIIATEGYGFVSSFPDIRLQLKKAAIGSVLTPGELLKVAQVLSQISSVTRRMNEYKRRPDLRIVPALVGGMMPQPELLGSINRCIESEDIISDNASPALADLRRRIARANDRIRERLNSFLHSPQTLKYLQEPIVTIRNDRYVIPVKQEYRTNVPGIIHDQSSSGATLFIEPVSVVEANNEVRQLKLKEEEEIRRILAELTARTAQVADSILDSMEIMAKLDFIFAKGAFSRALRGISPKLADSPSFRIVRGRHPLIDKDEVVPVSFELGKDFNILVITGPNTGGKTVTLKTAGLFVLMAQSGLHLPADFGTEMGIFYNVFADIGDEQSIEQSLSTFSSHMTNIVRILDEAGPGDLVLFDELGAGTDPTEGAALAMSILDWLNARGIMAMATTHYSELKVYALTRDGVENASMEFNIETLKPTYRLLTGIPGKSNAFEISRRLGLNSQLIENAKQYLSKEDIRFEDVLQGIEKSRVEAEQERIKAREYLEEIDRLKAEYKAALEKFEENKSKLLDKAREEARSIIRDARAHAESIIAELRDAAREQDAKEINRAIELSRKKLKDTQEELERKQKMPGRSLSKPPKDLQLGETVHIVSLDQKGQVLSLPDANGNVAVQAGIMKINVHISDLRRTEEDKPKQPKTGRAVNLRMPSISPELDLRGQSAEDAMLNTDRYLDEAFLAGLKEVTLIHGKGTGVLRNAIQQLLRNHPHVDSFRLGKFGEGESGVTVVVLK
ncbi:MAG TPA: endonuclease MutS2 [Candidatus Atribacteria bacterium]|mgnify:CR=1 FL=1|nr:endonuclease MutS2 [Candidatus Atribacteria bacterium]HPT78827.1 endonuclease MutS2 [Candidatus Atribacteria bacterium]